METIVLDKNIKVMYVTAMSFPDGIAEAQERIHRLVPFSTERKYYGISRPENGPIVYRAAAEELNDGEAEKLGLETLILKKGTYVCKTVHDYLKNPQLIEGTFEELLAQPAIDPEGYCVEWYLDNEDIKCMVRVKD